MNEPGIRRPHGPRAAAINADRALALMQGRDRHDSV
jgi:hypothetical protein